MRKFLVGIAIGFLVAFFVGGSGASTPGEELHHDWQAEVFQGQPCLHELNTDKVIQRTFDGKVIVLYEWERWTDSKLSEISGASVTTQKAGLK